jgi:putative glutamine amidotransferase
VSRPVIGICAALEEVSWGAWTPLSDVSPRSYSEAVQAAGGLALLLPSDDVAAEQPGLLLDLVDGLLLAGGADLDPAAYGARAHPETAGTRPERDRFELALTHAAVERELPVLGICRGMEVLNVACGGTLVQHLQGGERHRHTPGAFADHEVRLAEGTLAARAVGERRAAVKSHHHQGIDELGEGLAISGWAVEDDLVEAIELPSRPYALGVLWHPEQDQGSRVVASLVEAARAGRAER